MMLKNLIIFWSNKISNIRVLISFIKFIINLYIKKIIYIILKVVIAGNHDITFDEENFT